MSENNKTNIKEPKFVYKACGIVTLAGLLFGLNIAYVNGALSLISAEFDITSSTEKGYIAGFLLVGAAFGVFLSGLISKKLGRKNLLILSAILFCIFTFLGVISPSFDALIISRFIVGIAVGMASFIAPIYLSEIAPKQNRGAMITLYQLMITVGIFIMFLSNSILVETDSWRLMLSVLIIPSLILLICSFFLPKSPRWLMIAGKKKDSKDVLNKLRATNNEVNSELKKIEETTKYEQSAFKLLKNKFFLKVLLIGIVLHAGQQLSGINALMYYSTHIFNFAGFTDPRFPTVVLGLVNVLTTLIAVKYVDKFGRKPILYFGLTIIVISSIIIGVIFKGFYSYEIIEGVVDYSMNLPPALQWTIVFSSIMFVFGFAISLGPIIWILSSEIQPLEGRDLGITVATMTNWLCNAMIGQFAITWLTYAPGITFFSFGLICVGSIIFTILFVPETKQVSLEEIELNLREGKKIRYIGKART